MNVHIAHAKRPYRLGARAEAAKLTRQRILDAMGELWQERWYDEVTMREVAERAGVSTQTLINHFGTKEAILTAMLEQPIPSQWMTRMTAAPGDVRGAVRLLVRDYEAAGDAIIRSLALEGRIAALQPGLERGRRAHREWIEAVFPDAVSNLSGRAREGRVDLLVCATDVYTWKLLRRDRGLSQRATATAICELVEALHP